jgi:hypothetical protein
VRFANSSSSFILDLFPSLTLPHEFGEHLTTIPFESVRIVLIFLANMVQFTYFRSMNQVCPFCALNLSSTHLFECQSITPSPICDWQSFVSEVQNEDFRLALDRLFLVLQRWSTLTNRFQPGFTAHIDEYFTVTNNNQANRQPQVAIVPSGLQGRFPSPCVSSQF